MKNLFQLSTPLVYVRKIESNFDLSIELFQEHLFAIDLLYLNGTQWIEVKLLLIHLNNFHNNIFHF